MKVSDKWNGLIGIFSANGKAGYLFRAFMYKGVKYNIDDKLDLKKKYVSSMSMVGIVRKILRLHKRTISINCMSY